MLWDRRLGDAATAGSGDGSIGATDGRRSRLRFSLLDPFFFSCLLFFRTAMISGAAARMAQPSTGTATLRCWPLALSYPSGAVQQHSKTLRRGRHLAARIRSRPCPSGTPRGSTRRQFASAPRPACRCFVARFVGVVGDVHALRSVLLEGRSWSLVKPFTP